MMTLDAFDDGEPIGRRPVTYVPGVGAVEWSPAEVAEYAARLDAIHLPDRPTWTVRRRRGATRWPALNVLVGLVPRVTSTDARCVRCGLEWPCPAVAWARDNHSTTALIVGE